MDENKRTAIAVLLCIMVILTYQRMMMKQHVAPPKTAQAGPTPQTSQLSQSSDTQTSTAQVGTANAGTAATSAIKPHPSKAELEKSPFTTIDTGLISVRIVHLGARVGSFQLKKYKSHLGAEDHLDLITYVDGKPLPLGAYLDGVNDDYVQYSLQGSTQGIPQEGNTFKIPTTSELSLRFGGTLPDGSAITKTLTFSGNSYLLKVDLELAQPTKDGSAAWLEWSYYVADIDTHDSYNPRHFTLLGRNNKITLINTPEAPTVPTPYGDNQWVSFGDKYFMSTLMPTSQGINVKISRDGPVYLSQAAGTAKGGSYTLYVGPKNYSDLQAIGFQLERNVNLGWFTPFALPLLWMLKSFYALLGNYGLAIILLTLIIKTAFLPLTGASFRSMKAMQDLQPEMKALRERIQDPAQLNKEMMDLYKRRGVNPMGGCFPMLIQLPVFLGLYNALNNSIELRHAGFALWINDLSSPESLKILGIGVPVMILIMGASMFVQQITTPSAADPAQKKAMLMMPFVFTIMFIVYPFPAGLVLYWLINNIISITQQVYLRKEATPFRATVLASVAIFFLGYILTLIH